MIGTALLELKDVTYIYGENTPFRSVAVDHVTLSIEEGEYIGVIGHTGSGKSTLIQQFNGLLRPTSGKVFLRGKDIWEEPKKIRSVRFSVGMVFQYPEHQLFEDTVLRDIAFGPKNMGLSEKEAEEKARQAASFVGLREELLEKSPFELSGGEKRRAAIAGVIAMDPEVLILDEPTAGLDPSGRNLLLSQIEKYHQERKNTVLLVSHSMEDIAKAADRLLVMNKGKVELFDNTKAVFSQEERLEKIGLRVPQITKIMTRLAKAGIPVDPGVLTVDQAYDALAALLKGGDRA